MPRRLLNRQAASSAIPGILTDSTLVLASTPPGTSLSYASGGTSDLPAPALFSDATPTLFSPATSSSSQTSPSASPGVSVVSDNSSNNKFSMGAVIGICVGAFVGAVLLICVGVFAYRRSFRRPSNARRPPGSAGRSGRDTTWNKLGDDQDRWEGHGQTKEVNNTGLKKVPSVLKKTPSQKVLVQEFASTKRSSLTEHDLATAPFSKYHPHLAEELAQPPRPFAENKEKLSWDGTTVSSAVKDESFLSLRSVHIESGTMSPTLGPAKMTPPATASSIHHWESAEVVHPDQYDTLDQLPENPFADYSQPVTSKSHSNPFFGAQQNRPSARKHSLSDKDPFVDGNSVARIPGFSHSQTDSVMSTSSADVTDRAMKSLIAALELPQEEVERRLRIASMQPSEISNYSVDDGSSLYTNDYS